MNKKIAAGILALGLAGSLTACGGSGAAPAPNQEREVEEKAKEFTAYIPKNNVELNNYNRAQELYDNPAAIQWCTLFPPSDTAPIVTTPIAGKLTTSATSYFSPTEVEESYEGSLVNVPKRSVDGLFHGESHYRYGFTPGGDYVDFFNSAVVRCTTALTDFQRQNTFVELTNTEGDVAGRQAAAEEALAQGNEDEAAAILEGE